MVNRIFTQAYAGMRNWVLQRLTALLMSAYAVLMGTLLLAHRPSRYQAWKAVFSPSWMRIATLLFLLCLFIHAWLGVRDIYRDYVHSLALRSLLQWATGFMLLVYSVWSVKILWEIQ